MNSDPQARIFTIPNLISLARLIGVGWFLWLLLVDEEILTAAIVLIVIGGTDWVDGWLARALGQVSELGRRLDPIADRVALVAAVIGGTIAGVVPIVITAVLVLREIVMATVAGMLLARAGETLQVRWLGKASTFLLYGAVPSFYLAAADVLPGFFGFSAWFFGVIGLVLYVWVAGGYIREARDILAESAKRS